MTVCARQPDSSHQVSDHARMQRSATLARGREERSGQEDLPPPTTSDRHLALVSPVSEGDKTPSSGGAGADAGSYPPTHQQPSKEAHDFLSSLLLDSEGGEVWSGDRTVDDAVVASALHVSVRGSAPDDRSDRALPSNAVLPLSTLRMPETRSTSL